MDILLEEWVESQIRLKAQKVVRPDEKIFIVMLYLHIPAHKVHFQTKDDRVFVVIQQYEPHGLTVSDPHKVLAKTVMTALVDCQIADKPLPRCK